MLYIYYLLAFSLTTISGMSSEDLAYSTSKYYYKYISHFTDSRLQINCNICEIPFMNTIIKKLDWTTKVLPQDNLVRDMTSSNLYVNFFSLNMDNYTYDENEPSYIPCEIDPNGSYYITVGFGDHITGNLYSFEYNGMKFVTWRYLRGFFKGIKSIDLYKSVIIDNDWDDCGNFYDWRFVIDNGKIKVAVCYSSENAESYDLLLGKEISVHEFFESLPIPIHELNNPAFKNNSFKVYY